MNRISLSSIAKIAIGVKRPEDVVVGPDNRVWISDANAACSTIAPDGSLKRVGVAGGKPNGINMDRDDRIIIANFGNGKVQRLDTSTGNVETICSQVGVRKLYHPNYPILDKSGNIWCTHSTDAEPPRQAIRQLIDDGYLFRIAPDGTAKILAEGIAFANGLALDADESYIYVCQTTNCNVIRYSIQSDGSLGAPEHYGPQLGELWSPNGDPTRRGATDGCGFDQDGNLWVTLVAASRIVAITPSGDVEILMEDPEGSLLRKPTNVTWGGPDLRDLYIGSIESDYVLQARSPIAGLPLAHQRPYGDFV